MSRSESRRERSHLVFKNPVPMQFAKGLITQCIFHTFNDLENDLRLLDSRGDPSVQNQTS